MIFYNYLMKILPKLFNLSIVFFPIILIFSFAATHVIPLCTENREVLVMTVCEHISNKTIYAPKNFGASFSFLLFPIFIAVNFQSFYKFPSFTYELKEALFLVCLHVYVVIADGLFYGFSVHNSAQMSKSGETMLLAYVLAKTISKIPHSHGWKKILFWIIFSLFVLILDPFVLGVNYNSKTTDSTNLLVLSVVEIAYSKWVERKKMPNIFMNCALFLYFLSTLAYSIDESGFFCIETHPFQWLVFSRTLKSLFLFSFFVGFRKQENERNLLVQNRFEEVATEDDNQLI